MDLLESNASRLKFEACIDELVSVIGHADRIVPLHDYCTGLLLPGERKSVEPMAALLSPARTAPKHQSLLHFVVIAPWSDEAVLSKVRQMVLPTIETLGAIEASIIDDTEFPKKGKHSVGVARQYCGQLGGGSQGSVHEVNGKLPEGSSTTVRRWGRCRSPITTPVSPSPIGCIFPRSAQTTRNDEIKPRSRRTSCQNQTSDRSGPVADRAGRHVPLGTVLADSGYGYDSQFRDGGDGVGATEHAREGTLRRGHPIECADVEV
jgi:hypothetical protein